MYSRCTGSKSDVIGASSGCTGTNTQRRRFENGWWLCVCVLSHQAVISWGRCNKQFMSALSKDYWVFTGEIFTLCRLLFCVQHLELPVRWEADGEVGKDPLRDTSHPQLDVVKLLILLRNSCWCCFPLSLLDLWDITFRCSTGDRMGCQLECFGSYRKEKYFKRDIFT